MILQSTAAPWESVEEAEPDFLEKYSKKTQGNNRCATMETSTIKREYSFFPEGKHCNRSPQIMDISNPAILKVFKAQPHKAQSYLL